MESSATRLIAPDLTARRWRLDLRLGAQSLRSLDPLPLLLHLLIELPALRARAGLLRTALGELYANAVEHGVLGLDSALKGTPEGFAGYYRERQRRLRALVRGEVRFELDYRGDHNAGLLRIAVADSGPGFDFAAWRAGFPPRGYAGRGLALLERLGLDLQVPPPGNCVCAQFRWQESHTPGSRSGRPS